MEKTAEGLRFAVRVGQVTANFEGLPLLGFTRRRPCEDDRNLYPSVAKCLGQSVLLGGCGEASARDQVEHFQIGFKGPPASEVQTWRLEPEVPSHHRKAPVGLRPGDHLECCYMWGGRLQYWCGDLLVLDFDVGRPLDEAANYYAVADVGFTACSLTLVPCRPSATVGVAYKRMDSSARTSACDPRMPSFGDLSTALGDEWDEAAPTALDSDSEDEPCEEPCADLGADGLAPWCGVEWNGCAEAARALKAADQEEADATSSLGTPARAVASALGGCALLALFAGLRLMAK